MLKSQMTKYSLVSSLISVFLCTVMLIGTTFAWFTDKASTSVADIQSGTLDIALSDAAGENIEGETLEWVKAQGEDEVLWEPGCTYKLDEIYIENKGNLALKYKVIVDGIEGDEKLLEAIDFTVTVNDEEIDLADFEGDLLPEESEALKIEGHMDEEAGNEYQGLAIEGISITVKAAQLPYEYDSFDNQYDADAPYADDAEDEEPEDVIPEYKSCLKRITKIDIANYGKNLRYGSTIFQNFDAGLISEVPAESISITDCSSKNVKAVLVLEEDAVVKKIIFAGTNSFVLDEGGKLVENLSGGEVKIEISGSLKINGISITQADQLADYLRNISDITFK